ncbi:DUF397 domain-containing protein [Embleya sp. NBC_00896]|uniref:DUF397 domain-containing protein n=1 Tax=Embleya sp. NBC_00896 TaxID=2975961 RepID=UPI0038635D4A|nr:DUF397 domain-containing protein [Embleya sp. NBC_00896]
MRTASELTAAQWRKSSYSNGQGGDCVEVAAGFTIVPVRDSKDLDAGHLLVSPGAWSALVAALRIA